MQLDTQACSKLHDSCSLRLLRKFHNRLQDRVGMWLTLLDHSQRMQLVKPKTLEIWIHVPHRKPPHSVPRKHSWMLACLPSLHSQDSPSAGISSSLGFVSLFYCQASLRVPAPWLKNWEESITCLMPIGFLSPYSINCFRLSRDGRESPTLMVPTVLCPCTLILVLWSTESFRFWKEIIDYVLIYAYLLPLLTLKEIIKLIVVASAYNSSTGKLRQVNHPGGEWCLILSFQVNWIWKQQRCHWACLWGWSQKD